MVIEKFIRYGELAVGLMVVEQCIRYAGLAVGLKPSARGGEGRRRGLERMMYSKDHTPSAMGCEARRRGRERMNFSKTIALRDPVVPPIAGACPRVVGMSLPPQVERGARGGAGSPHPSNGNVGVNHVFPERKEKPGFPFLLPVGAQPRSRRCAGEGEIGFPYPWGRNAVCPAGAQHRSP